MIDPVLERKFSSLSRCLKRLTEKRPDTLSELEGNYDLQDIISINLERTVQISVDIAAFIISERDLRSTSTMAGAFASLESAGIIAKDISESLQKSVGFRNVSVHEYTEVDWKIIFNVLHHNLDTFRRFMQAVFLFYETKT